FEEGVRIQFISESGEGPTVSNMRIIKTERAADVMNAIAENGLQYEERTYRLPIVLGNPLLPHSSVIDAYEVEAPPVIESPLTPTDPLGEEPEAGQ
ncbi:MAG: hypothetical protein AAF830_16045, partial [Pseudomonadota bacterium]